MRRYRSGARRLLVPILLALALLSSACDFDGAYDLPLPGSVVDEESAFEITAEFRDVLNVVPRSPVKVDDVTVGEITEVDRVGWHARVTMLIRDDVRLPDNAVAEIRQTSLLGAKYVALLEPRSEESTGRLGEGDSLPLNATGRNPAVEEVLGALSFLLSGGGVGQLATITEELNLVMSGRTDRLRSLLAKLDSVVGTIDDQKTEIIRALEAVNSLSATLNTERDTIREALDVMGPAVSVLAEQHDELVATLTALERLGKVGTRVIRASKEDVLQVLADLRPVLRKLNEAGEALPGGLSLLLSFPFPEEAQEVVKGDFANTEIKLDISLRNLGGNPLTPDLPIPDLGTILDKVGRCISSGSLGSKICRQVLEDVTIVDHLIRECQRPRNSDKVVCRLLNPLNLPGGGEAGEGPLSGLLGGLLGGLGLPQSPGGQQPGKGRPKNGGQQGDGGLLGGIGLFGEGL